MIGIAVVTPFGLRGFRPGTASSRSTGRARFQIGSTACANRLGGCRLRRASSVATVLSACSCPSPGSRCVPGIEGVSVALMSIQLGLVLAIVIFPARAIDVLDFQARMLILVGHGSGGRCTGQRKAACGNSAAHEPGRAGPSITSGQHGRTGGGHSSRDQPTPVGCRYLHRAGGGVSGRRTLAGSEHPRSGETRRRCKLIGRRMSCDVSER